MAIRTGRFTITLPSRPVVQGFAAVAGKKEGEGPLAAEFDHIFDDTPWARFPGRRRRVSCTGRP